MIDNFDAMIEPMTTAPDSELDAIVVKDLVSLLGESCDTQLNGLIDGRNKCVYGGLASGFVMAWFNAVIDTVGSNQNMDAGEIQALSDKRGELLFGTR